MMPQGASEFDVEQTNASNGHISAPRVFPNCAAARVDGRSRRVLRMGASNSVGHQSLGWIAGAVPSQSGGLWLLIFSLRRSILTAMSTGLNFAAATCDRHIQPRRSLLHTRDTRECR